MVRSSVITPPTRVVSSVPENPRRYAQRGLLIRANSKAAIKALMANGSRSMLTMLGVIIGVAAVITAVTQAEGTSASINQRFSSLGTNILTVMPGQPPSLSGKGGFVVRLGGSKSSTLTLNDAQALTALAHVSEISPILQTSTTAIFQDENGQFPVYGVSVDYQTIHSLQLAEGSWFSQIDNDTRAPKIVIGANVAQTLFTPLKVDPIGKTVRIGSELFQVIGVLASSSPLVDTNIYAPFNTVQVRLLNATTADQIEVLVDDANNIDQVQQEITDELDKLHRIGGPKTQDFWFQSATQLVQNQQANQA